MLRVELDTYLHDLVTVTKPGHYAYVDDTRCEVKLKNLKHVALFHNPWDEIHGQEIISILREHFSQEDFILLEIDKKYDWNIAEGRAEGNVYVRSKLSIEFPYIQAIETMLDDKQATQLKNKYQKYNNEYNILWLVKFKNSEQKILFDLTIGKKYNGDIQE